MIRSVRFTFKRRKIISRSSKRFDWFAFYVRSTRRITRRNEQSQLFVHNSFDSILLAEKKDYDYFKKNNVSRRKKDRSAGCVDNARLIKIVPCNRDVGFNGTQGIRVWEDRASYFTRNGGTDRWKVKGGWVRWRLLWVYHYRADPSRDWSFRIWSRPFHMWKDTGCVNA